MSIQAARNGISRDSKSNELAVATIQRPDRCIHPAMFSPIVREFFNIHGAITRLLQVPKEEVPAAVLAMAVDATIPGKAHEPGSDRRTVWTYSLVRGEGLEGVLG